MSRLARMHWWSRWLPATIPLGVVAIIASQPVAAHAQASIFGTYTNSGGLFNYNLSVQNTGLTTLLLVDITVPAAPSPTNLFAPAGFQTVLGSSLVTFLPANPLTNGEFTPGRTVSGFRFSLPTLLNAPAFVATDENLTETRGTVQLTAAAAAPEPGTLGLFALAGIPFAASIVTRRRFAASRSLKG